MILEQPAAVRMPRLGLRENLGQFALLLLVNAFVGAMVGMERVVLPVLAEREFGIAARTTILSFLVAFGAVKAAANLVAGAAADRFGRRATLLAGWLFGLPVPFLIVAAPTWHWVVAANVLLGINQGLCWSAAIVMKVDLVGPRHRGLAIGLNESTGYIAVSLSGLAAGYLAAHYGLRPYPFTIGMVAAVLGLLTSLWVRDTRAHAAAEAASPSQPPRRTPRHGREVFRRVSWSDPSLRAVTQAGLVNNLNDGLSWGLLPLYFTAAGMTLERVAWLTALYPAIWGVGQLVAGPLSDRVSRRLLMAAGMILQGAGLVAVGASREPVYWITGVAALGIGTAMVYPTFLSAISHHSLASWRATAIGVFRLWRDLGYVIGAIVAGVLADRFGMPAAIVVVGAATIASGLWVARSYRENPT